MENKPENTIIAEILENTRTIAVIGIKKNENEDAYKVPFYMYKHGYQIFPVNPKFAGETLFDEPVVSKVNEFITPVDLVNIFRRPEHLFTHAAEILTMYPLPKYVWFQLGIYNDEAADLLEKSGIKVIQNRCIMVEHNRLKT